ncbi:MAG TPA: hypothetical protein P5277_02555 [Candidatus Paceibacterota bacterium]|nr:hypothetical protein [Candidatus Paceibacterota bacterium]
MVEKEIPKKESNLPIYLVVGIIALVLVGLFIAFVTPNVIGNVVKSFQNCEDVQVAYNETEYYTEPESYSDKDCTNVNMIFKSTLVKNQKECMQEECATYNQVCADYNQECATYTQQCADYDDECESYNQVCVEKNFWGNCVKYQSVCASYKEVCVSYKPVCSDYKNVCNSYKSVCGAYKCIKYKFTCGLKVDNQEKQALILNIGLYKQDFDSKTSILINTQNNWVVNSLDSRQLNWEFTALPTENVGCSYNFLNSPTMQVCRDVVKSRDVQKTRIITRYRTEQKCS